MRPKGFYFASGGADSMIFLWSTNKAAPVMSFVGHTNDVTIVDITENLNYICSASLDKTFRIWNIENAQMVRILFFEQPISR
jgi:WD40 repeat protein